MLIRSRVYIVLFLLILGVAAQAQQDPQYTQYMYNIGSFNPAYVGSVESTDINLLYRSQWIDIPGAPRTIRFGVNAPLVKCSNMRDNVPILRNCIGVYRHVKFTRRFPASSH